MRRLATPLAIAALLAAAPAAAPAQQMSFSQAQLVRSLLPSVVNITARAQLAPTPEPMLANAAAGGKASRTAAPVQLRVNAGSGFVIDAAGDIATNWHVVVDAYEITVTFADGTHAPAKLVNASPLVDLAVIRVAGGHKLAPVRWGDSSRIAVGDPVLAIGNPLGVGLSVSGGLVSALNRNIMDTPYDDFIQTDAAINHGNSGGPLFDMKGEVIGVNSALISPTAGNAGLGFAMPANDARFILERLIHAAWKRPGYIGVRLQPVSAEMADALGLAEPAGFIVAEVEQGSPAARAGIGPGDVLLTYAGETPPDERALLRAIARTEPGSAVPVTYRRAGVTQSATVTVDEWPGMWWETPETGMGAAPHWQVPRDLGLMLAPLSTETRATYEVRALSGVVITGVLPGTDAAQRGLGPGDVIVRVNDTPVASAEEVQRAIDAARAAKHAYVLMLVDRKNQAMTPAQRPAPKWIALRVAPS